MNRSQKILGAIILLLMAISLYGFWISREPGTVRVEQPAKKAKDSSVTLVDLSPLKVAQQVAQLAETSDERALAQQALHIADYEVDLAFDAALRDALLHPLPLGPEAKEIQA